MTQRRDERRGLLAAVQHLLDQPLVPWGTAVQAGNIAGNAGFIDEGLTLGGDVRPILLGGVQAFFKGQLQMPQNSKNRLLADRYLFLGQLSLQFRQGDIRLRRHQLDISNYPTC